MICQGSGKCRGSLERGGRGGRLEKWWMGVSSDREQWGPNVEGYFSGSILCW